MPRRRKWITPEPPPGLMWWVHDDPTSIAQVEEAMRAEMFGWDFLVASGFAGEMYWRNDPDYFAVDHVKASRRRR